MMKTKLDNDVTSRTNVVYGENQIELPCSIELNAVYDKQHTTTTWRIA